MFVARHSWDTWVSLLDHAALVGMSARLGDKECHEVLREFLDIAARGLIRRGLGEGQYLESLYRRVDEKRVPAADVNKWVKKLNHTDFLKKISYS